MWLRQEIREHVHMLHSNLVTVKLHLHAQVSNEISPLASVILYV